MSARLAAVLHRRSVTGWMAASLVLGIHAALGWAVGAAGNGGLPGPAAGSPVMTVQLHAGGIDGDAPGPAPSPEAAAGPGATARPAALLSVAIAPPRYFPPAELSEYPSVIDDVTPDIAALDLPPGPEQSAVLRLLINESGDIDQVAVIRSQLPAKVIAAAIAAYSRLKFHPGKIGGLRVKSQIDIEVRLENTPAALQS